MLKQHRVIRFLVDLCESDVAFQSGSVPLSEKRKNNFCVRFRLVWLDQSLQGKFSSSFTGFPDYLALDFYLGNTSFWDENLAHNRSPCVLG